MRLQLSALASAAGRGVRVAVIDSGVHALHPHVQGVSGGVGIDEGGAGHDDYVDRLGHGTAVTAVVREKAPAAEIFAVKVFDRELSATGAALVAALAWARRHRAHLVNLSLGTTNPAHEAALAAEVRAARDERRWIVAAGPDAAARWLPGGIPGAIAVTMDDALPRDVIEVAIDDDGRVSVRACGYPRPIPGVPPERNLRGLSFAVANATGLIARVLEVVRPGEDLAAAIARVAGSSALPSR